MNVNTGHLVDKSIFTGTLPPDYEAVPAMLATAARRKLAGRTEAQVSLTSGGKLSKWAAGRRKSRRKLAAASRRANR